MKFVARMKKKYHIAKKLYSQNFKHCSSLVGFLCCAATKQRQHDTQQRSLVCSKRAYYNQNLHYVTNV